MRKILFKIFIIMLLFALPVFADNEDNATSGDLWDSFNSTNDNYKQDKAVSDEDFEKAIESVKKKQHPFATLLKKDKPPKGDEQSQGNESEILNTEIEPENNTPVVGIPVEINLGDAVLPVGHYQVIGEKKDDKVVLKLYQAQYLMAEIPATETRDDFDEETISFAKWIAHDDETIKLIYGSMDFNAFTILKIKY